MIAALQVVSVIVLCAIVGFILGSIAVGVISFFMDGK